MDLIMNKCYRLVSSNEANGFAKIVIEMVKTLVFELVITP
jgi:hypothetical protein